MGGGGGWGETAGQKSLCFLYMLSAGLPHLLFLFLFFLTLYIYRISVSLSLTLLLFSSPNFFPIELLGLLCFYFR